MTHTARDAGRQLEWRTLPLYVVHEPITFLSVGASHTSVSCRGCGQRYPCDAIRLADALVSVLVSFHATPSEARECGGHRCAVAMHVLDTPQQSDMYGDEP